MRTARLADNGIGRTVFGAEVAADTQFGADAIGHQWLALMGAALLLPDVLHILVVEVVEGRQYRVGRCLAKSAQRCVLDDASHFLEHLQIVHRAFTIGDAVQDLQHPFIADTTGDTFSARLTHGKLQIELGDGDHAVVLVHHNHSARTHHAASGEQ